jgi:hypothetical protein
VALGSARDGDSNHRGLLGADLPIAVRTYDVRRLRLQVMLNPSDAAEPAADK